MPYGAFAEIIPNVDGLIHISQIADKRIEKTEDALKVGDVVTAKITDADWDAKKISLSIRALIAPPVEEKAEEVKEEVPADTEDTLVDIAQYIADEQEAEAQASEEE